MPIRVKCSCGKTLSAPDNLAGRKARCSGCQQIIQIPAPALPDATAAAEAEPLGERATACPSCAAAAEADAVICMACGYNFKTGASLVAAQESTPPPGVPRKADMEERDAERAKFERESQKKRLLTAGSIFVGGIILAVLVKFFGEGGAAAVGAAFLLPVMIALNTGTLWVATSIVGIRPTFSGLLVLSAATGTASVVLPDIGNVLGVGALPASLLGIIGSSVVFCIVAVKLTQASFGEIICVIVLNNIITMILGTMVVTMVLAAVMRGV